MTKKKTTGMSYVRDQLATCHQYEISKEKKQYTCSTIRNSRTATHKISKNL